MPTIHISFVNNSNHLSVIVFRLVYLVSELTDHCLLLQTPRSPFTQLSSPVIEHGVMFQCSLQGVSGTGIGEKTKCLPTLHYWVVG